MTKYQYLLSFAIGPVQPFIATARRTQDLWIGSRLLSDLMGVGIKAIWDKTELIFPDKEMVEEVQDKDRGGLSHKFLVLCDEPTTIAQTAQEAIKTAWIDRAEKVWRYLLEKNNLKVHKRFADLEQIWIRQTNPKHLFEFYWAAVRYDGVSYQPAYHSVGRMLAARKTIRNFRPVEEPGIKCKIDGEREALPVQLSRNRSKQKDGECLSAISAIKRFYDEAYTKPDKALERFPSTSTVAIAPFMEKLLTFELAVPQVGEIQKNFRCVLKDLENERSDYPLTHSSHPKAVPALSEKGNESTRSLDGDLFFPDTFNINGRLRNDYDFPDNTPNEKIRATIEALGQLRSVMQEWADIRPNPYFATLVMDGDQMGKRLSQVAKKEKHQEISRSLFEFTKEVENVVNRYLGRLVYAGGDDVFAFLPVETVLQAANEIRQAFSHKLEGGHMSAGIAIAHHLAPLGFIRRQAQSAEKAAKNDYQRNALCVTLLKRSGAPLTVGAQWNSCIIEVMLELVTHFKTGTLSSKLVYDVSLVAATLAGSELPPEAKVAELWRLLKRHRAKSCSEQIKQEIDLLAQRLINLAESIQNVIVTSDKTRSGVEEMADWLKLARFLAGGGGKNEF